MKTTHPVASRLARLLLAVTLFTTLLTPITPAQAASEKYWVNLILTRGPGVSDQVWNDTWAEFRNAFLPSFQSQLPGRAEFRVLVGDQHANFYLVNATTSNFNLTSRSFRAIPGMLPVIPELSVSVDGPYRGGPPPLVELSFGGKGNGSANLKVNQRMREGQTKSYRCKIENSADNQVACSYRMSGSAFDRQNCRLKVFDGGGRNVTAKLKAGRSISPSILNPSAPTGLGRVVITSYRDSDLRINSTSNLINSAPGNPATLSSKRTMCQVEFDVTE